MRTHRNSHFPKTWKDLRLTSSDKERCIWTVLTFNGILAYVNFSSVPDHSVRVHSLCHFPLCLSVLSSIQWSLHNFFNPLVSFCKRIIERPSIPTMVTQHLLLLYLPGTAKKTWKVNSWGLQKYGRTISLLQQQWTKVLTTEYRSLSNWGHLAEKKGLTQRSRPALTLKLIFFSFWQVVPSIEKHFREIKRGT